MDKYIKLDDAIATLHKYFPLSFDRQNAEDDLKSIPAADVEEVKHGEWQKEPTDFSLCGIAYYSCSLCGFEEQIRTNYCPKCGARMDGGRVSERVREKLSVTEADVV